VGHKMCKICRRNRNIEQTYTYIVHHQQVTSNTANSQTGLPCTAKVTDIPVNTHANNSPVNRICFALNNSTSSRRKASFKLAYIFRQYATSEPRATLVDTMPVHATPHMCWQSRYRLTGGKRGGDRVCAATSKYVRRRQACT